QADAFNIRPDQGTVKTRINVYGEAPIVAPGDTLTLNLTTPANVPLSTPTLTLGPDDYSGDWSFGSEAGALHYEKIESVSTSGARYNLVLDMKVAGYAAGGTVVAAI